MGGIVAYDASISQQSLQEICSVKPGHCSGSELPTFAKCRWEQWRVRLFSQRGDFEVFVQNLLQLMVNRNLFFLASFSL
jgi:hypothetical protein